MRTSGRFRFATCAVAPVASLVAVTIALVLALTALPAAAAIKNVKDPRGDHATPGYDITRVRYRNTTVAITSTVWLAKLRTNTRADFQVAARDGYSTTYGAVVRRRNGVARAQLWRYAIEGPGEKIACDDLTARWSSAKHRIAVTIPTACLDLSTTTVAMTTYVAKRGAPSWSDQSPLRRVSRD